MAEVRDRKLHYDILRILAAFSVVILHSAAQFWYELDIRSTQWIIANSYDAVFRFGVPVFVMISGAIFLDTDYELNIRRLYKHNILRLVILYIIWSCAYGLFNCRMWDFEAAGIKAVLKSMLRGHYHLWFIPMIVSIYVLLPILKSWIEKANRKIIEYFLVLFLVLQILSETFRALVQSDELNYVLDLGKVEMVCGYIGYFVLGYYLAHIGLRDRLKKIVYALFIPSIMANVILGFWLAQRANAPMAAIFDSYGLFTFLIVVAIFVFVCEKGKEKTIGAKTGKVVEELSADTLGIYILHVGFMEYTRELGFHSMVLPNIIGIPLHAVGCFIVCALVAAIIRRIPFIGRFLC